MIASRGQASHSNRRVASEVFRLQPGLLSDPPQHPWSDLVRVVEGQLEIRPTRPGQQAVRTVLTLHPLPDPPECSQYTFRFTGGPVAHRE
jgi:hypothetical protein